MQFHPSSRPSGRPPLPPTPPSQQRQQASPLFSASNGSSESDVELMRTIIGEHVPQSVILTCLQACKFDVSEALNWYFMEIAAHEDSPHHRTPSEEAESPESGVLVQAGLSLTLHSRNIVGMISKTDTGFATLTRGEQSYDMLTPSNTKFKTIRLRKRDWRTGKPPLFPTQAQANETHVLQRPYFANGDVVTLESNGLWLRTTGGLNSKLLQWKSPTSEDERCKFVIRGLPLGRNLRPGDYFFLTSAKDNERELVLKQERPVGVSSYDTSVHRGFLALDRIRTQEQRLYFYVKLTDNALQSIKQPGDMIDLDQLDIHINGVPTNKRGQNLPNVPPPSRKESITDELSMTDAKVDQMRDIIGEAASRAQIVHFLDGADGDVQVALEHYFMSVNTNESPVVVQEEDKTDEPRLTEEEAHVQEAQAHHHRRPKSELIFAIPSQEDTTTEAVEEEGKISEVGVAEVETPLEEEALTIQDFEMLSVLGKGSFGAVMLVRFKKDGRVFALKILKKTNMDKSDVLNAMEERQILQRLDHPYICGLIFAFQTNERLYLGMKYYAAGDLFYHLNVRGSLDLRDTQLYAAELTLAISYLHELNILYRDLKPSNVMIDSEGHIGVVDFGLSKQHIYGSSHGVKTLSGTAEYVAPEALTQTADGGRDYGKAYDWWSLGVVIYEMLVGESPFYDENEHKMLTRIAYSPVKFPQGFPKDAMMLVKGLLSKDPATRLGSEDMGGVESIKQDHFFKGVDWEKLSKRQVKARWVPKLESETDTRYVDPEFIDEGPPSAAYDPSAQTSNSLSKRFSQFSFNYKLN